MGQARTHAADRWRSKRRGSALVWASLTLSLLLGIASLVVEAGRVRSIKAEMQSCADATALSIMGAYADGGMIAANAAAITYSAANPVDKSSGIAPTIAFVGGTWSPVTKTFSTTYAPGTPAVRVNVSRTAANNNAVALPLGSVVGMSRCNVQAMAVATLIENDSGPITLNSTANMYLAGMPAGTSNSFGDTTTNATPYTITSISVVPGTYVSVTSPAGTTSIVPGTTPYVNADGEASRLLHHRENYDGSDWGIGPENGIGDAIVPAGTMTGMFLTDDAPTVGATPATVDWSSASARDQATYASLQLKSPFPIGDGKTSGGTVQKFLVPPGATRMFLSVWDGTASNNNGGTLTATINLTRSIRLVK